MTKSKSEQLKGVYQTLKEAQQLLNSENVNMYHSIQEKIRMGRAIDLSAFPKEGDDYILQNVIEGMDYCGSDCWIWSIGKRKSDGVILASHTMKFYENPAYECLWLR